MKQIELDFTPEKLGKNEPLHGGITCGSMQAWTNDLSAQQSKIDSVKSTMAGIFKKLEEAGANKKAVKQAMSLNDMPDDLLRDHLKALVSTMEALGTFERLGIYLCIAVPPGTQKETGKPEAPQETNLAKIALEKGKPAAATAAAH